MKKMKKNIKNKLNAMLISYRPISVFVLLLGLIVNNTYAQEIKSEQKKQIIEKRSVIRIGQNKGPKKILLSELQQKITAPVENNKALPVFQSTYPKVKYGNTGKLEKIALPSTYTFTGKGQWTDAANWANNLLPPAILQSGDKVVINGKGACLFNNIKLFSLEEGSSVEIKEGAALYVSISNYFIFRGGTITNNGKLTVLSSNMPQQWSTPGNITNNGEFKITQLSKTESDFKNPKPPLIAPEKASYMKADFKKGPVNEKIQINKSNRVHNKQLPVKL